MTRSHDRQPKSRTSGDLKDLANAVRRSAVAVKHLSPSCLAIHGDNRLVLPRLPDASVHCTISSPPYGDQKNYGSPDEIGSGNADYLGYQKDLRRVVAELHRVTVAGGAMWLVLDTLKRDGHSIPLPFQAINIAEDHGWVYHECVIWDKGKSLPWSHTAHFRGVFEYVLLFVKGSRVRHFDLDSVRDTDHLSSYWVKYPERYNPLGKAPTDLWHIPIPVQGSWAPDDLRHLCPFPEELVRRMIAITSRAGDVVLDPFSGTGVVPAMASAMERVGIGIELNARYFDAFVSKGFDRVARSASASTTNKSPKLATIIRNLRVLKYPKTLFAQISRADRLGDEARSMIDGILVNREEGEDAEGRERIRVVLLARAKAHVARLEKSAATIRAIAPLSKFQLAAKIEVVEPHRWKTGAYRPIHAQETWYHYRAGNFNEYAARLTADQMKSALRDGDLGKKTRVPPIFSKLGVKVRAGISD